MRNHVSAYYFTRDENTRYRDAEWPIETLGGLRDADTQLQARTHQATPPSRRLTGIGIDGFFQTTIASDFIFKISNTNKSAKSKSIHR